MMDFVHPDGHAVGIGNLLHLKPLLPFSPSGLGSVLFSIRLTDLDCLQPWQWICSEKALVTIKCCTFGDLGWRPGEGWLPGLARELDLLMITLQIYVHHSFFSSTEFKVYSLHLVSLPSYVGYCCHFSGSHICVI